MKKSWIRVLFLSAITLSGHAALAAPSQIRHLIVGSQFESAGKPGSTRIESHRAYVQLGAPEKTAVTLERIRLQGSSPETPLEVPATLSHLSLDQSGRFAVARTVEGATYAIQSVRMKSEFSPLDALRGFVGADFVGNTGEGLVVLADGSVATVSFSAYTGTQILPLFKPKFDQAALKKLVPKQELATGIWPAVDYSVSLRPVLAGQTFVLGLNLAGQIVGDFELETAIDLDKLTIAENYLGRKVDRPFTEIVQVAASAEHIFVLGFADVSIPALVVLDRTKSQVISTQILRTQDGSVPRLLGRVSAKTPRLAVRMGDAYVEYDEKGQILVQQKGLFKTLQAKIEKEIGYKLLPRTSLVVQVGN